MGLGGLSYSWCLPTMQPFLEAEFKLGAVETGGLLMLDGITYALATPFWGWALDAGLLSPLQSLFMGSLCITVGYSFLGLASNVSMIGIGMSLSGLGVASCYLITYMLMLSSSIESGLVQDTEQTQGMLTSLWFCFESLGGYFGSAISGWAYDMIGFRSSTLIIIGTQAFSMLSMSVMWLVDGKHRKENTREKGYQQVPEK